MADTRDSHWQHPAYTVKRGFWRENSTVSVDILAQKAAEDGINFHLTDNSVYLCKETIPVQYVLRWRNISDPMPHYDRVKEIEMEAGGSSLDQSRPLMTDARRVTFPDHPTPTRPHVNVGFRDIRICNCPGPPTVRVGNICT